MVIDTVSCLSMVLLMFMVQAQKLYIGEMKKLESVIESQNEQLAVLQVSIVDIICYSLMSNFGVISCMLLY